MKVSYRFKIVCLALMTLIWGLMNVDVCSAQSRNEKEVLQRVNEFYQNFSTTEYESMWKMTSKNFKRKNDKKAYIDGLQRFQNVPFTFKVECVSLARRKAVVTIRKCAVFSIESKEKCDVTDENWVFESGKWVFDL
jgi:hypothetical protein